MTTFRTITDLTPAARADLIEFCAKHLKPGYDADRYADGMIEQADFSDGAHFEIRGLHTRTGNPITTSYGDGEVVWTEYDEDGNEVAR